MRKCTHSKGSFFCVWGVCDSIPRGTQNILVTLHSGITISWVVKHTGSGDQTWVSRMQGKTLYYILNSKDLFSESLFFFLMRTRAEFQLQKQGLLLGAFSSWLQKHPDRDTWIHIVFGILVNLFVFVSSFTGKNQGRCLVLSQSKVGEESIPLNSTSQSRRNSSHCCWGCCVYWVKSLRTGHFMEEKSADSDSKQPLPDYIKGSVIGK